MSDSSIGTLELKKTMNESTQYATTYSYKSESSFGILIHNTIEIMLKALFLL